MTRKQAKQYGYTIVRGSYTGTTDDRADRWYIDDQCSRCIDHRGKGFRTVADALERVREQVISRMIN